MQVEMMQIASVKEIIRKAERDIFAETNRKVRLLICSEKIGITPAYVEEVVSHVFGVSIATIKGKRRDRDIVDARRAVAMILREYRSMTYVEIAACMKLANHTTVLNLLTTGRYFLKYRDEKFYPKYNSAITIIDSRIVLNKIQ